VCISAIPIDTFDHEGEFVWLEELPGFVGVFGEVDEGDVADDCDDDRDDTLPWTMLEYVSLFVGRF
jgi:hypothetical protein